jgi:hypothetical protein
LDPDRDGAGQGGTVAEPLGARGRIVIRFDALNLLGAPAATAGGRVSDDPAAIMFQSPLELASATLEITDARGEAVLLAPALESIGRSRGAHVYRLGEPESWTLSTGERVAAGNYAAVVRGVPVGADYVLTSEAVTVRVGNP